MSEQSSRPDEITDQLQRLVVQCWQCGHTDQAINWPHDLGPVSLVMNPWPTRMVELTCPTCGATYTTSVVVRNP